MKESFNINKSIINDKTVFNITGRIDANRSAHLDTALGNEMHEGNYAIELNLRDVNYISSAGIGILIKFYKLLKGVNGYLYISDVPEHVKSVLSLVGLSELFKPIDITASSAEHSNVINEKTEVINDVKYFIQQLHTEKPLDCYLSGNPELLNVSGFAEENARVEKIAGKRYGIGMGTIGNSFHDCANRFGEFAEFGSVAVHLPGDGSNHPDYAFETGNYVPEIISLYSVFFEGDFSYFIRFETGKNRLSVCLSELIGTCINRNGITSAGIVMIAETSGLIGASVHTSPLKNKQGVTLFQFPEVREHIRYTTEPAYDKMLTLITGIAVKDKNDLISPYTRPISTGSGTRSHFHAAVFPYRPLKKDNINLEETVHSLFESDGAVSMLHLLNDDREITGIGESEFIKGYCWLGSIGSVTKHKEEKR